MQIKSSDSRVYFLCDNCHLINVSHKNLIPPKEERERYLTHNNGMEFKGYVNFLNKAIDPALQFLEKEMLGLDFGCGHKPTLSKLLAQHGFNCEDYDPFFIENKLDKRYDFIFSTEVFEHFFNPKKEISNLMNLITKNGILIVMTDRWKDINQFNSNWHYARDISHVVFYHNKTFEYICKEYNLKILYDDKSRIVILRKN